MSLGPKAFRLLRDRFVAGVERARREEAELAEIRQRRVLGRVALPVEPQSKRERRRQRRRGRAA